MQQKSAFNFKIVGNYMSKQPPAIIFSASPSKNRSTNPESSRISSSLKKEEASNYSPISVQRYIFNTPSDIQRNLKAHNIKLKPKNAFLFWTTHSHDVLHGFVPLVLATYQHNKDQIIRVNYRMFLMKQSVGYFHKAMFHLGYKGLGLAWETFRGNRVQQQNEQGAQKTGKTEGSLVDKAADEQRIGIQDGSLYQKVKFSDNLARYLVQPSWWEEWVTDQRSPELSNISGFLHSGDTGRAQFFEDENVIIRPFHFKSHCDYLVEYKDSNGCQNSGVFILTHESGSGISSDQLAINKYLESRDSVLITHVIHILKQESNVLLKSEFIQRIQSIDSIAVQINRKISLKYKSEDSLKASIKVQHILYGFGFQTEAHNISYLLHSFFKGVRFYSMIGHLCKFVPQIQRIHLNFWRHYFSQSQSHDLLNQIKKHLKVEESDFSIHNPFSEYSIGKEYFQKKQSKNMPILTENAGQIASNLEKVKLQLQQICRTFNYDTKVQNYQKSKKYSEFDPKIIFLGTNSFTPNELRNVSGILIELPQISEKDKQKTQQSLPNRELLALLDCGEGTYEQFLWHFSPKIMEQKLLSLEIVFMTHLHADHNLGILNMIHQRNQIVLRRQRTSQQHLSGRSFEHQSCPSFEPLFLIIPFNTIGWIHNYCQSVQDIVGAKDCDGNSMCKLIFIQTLTEQKVGIKDLDFEMQSLEKGKKSSFKQMRCSQLTHYSFKAQNLTENNQIQQQHFLKQLHDVYSNAEKQSLAKEQFQRLLKKWKIRKFLPTKVFHCPQSYGIVIEHEVSNIKISYSGDCRPTPEFLKAAQKSDLLIHEATYATGQEKKAKEKAHSTFQEALQAGLTAQAKNICLTHFEPGPFDRVAAELKHKNKWVPELWRYFKHHSIVACDHLEFSLSQIPEVVKVSKVISRMAKRPILNQLGIYSNRDELEKEQSYKERRLNQNED